MVESDGKYVLQWDDHSKHITERFSSLLARQSHVDVTLICEKQKLHVHKLVLASSSLYFEEMLEQDLGHEPIIYLCDLNFEVLKAMVEFMYCGETTISHPYLKSLLEAAKIFKVKELASIASSILDHQSQDIEDRARNNKELMDAHELDFAPDIFDDNVCTQQRNIHVDSGNKNSSFDTNGNSDTSADENQSQGNMTNGDGENEAEDTLYDESFTFGKDEIESLKVSTLECSSKENECANMGDDVVLNSDSDHELQPLLYEQCCDFIDNETTFINDHVHAGVSPLLEHAQSYTETMAQFSDLKVASNKVEKHLKVYSHKRRKSQNGKINNSLKHVSEAVPELSSASCIDLSNEPVNNDAPITLSASLDMESTDYSLSLSTENIEAVVGCAMSESNSQIRCNNEDDSFGEHVVTNFKNTKQTKKPYPVDSENSTIGGPRTISHRRSSMSPPVLRRSVRLNQQENDDSVNNNVAQEMHEGKNRVLDFRKDNDPIYNLQSSPKVKRKAKDSTPLLDRNIPDENTITVSQPTKRNANSPRALRSASKLIARNGNKSRYTLARSNKANEKSKTNGKLKSDKIEALGIFDTPACIPIKPNTIASVNRALWGDMTDFLEYSENGMDFPEHSPSKEIPFAVGLLPLRAALERMQATPDYQPRKTRSSVAPLKQEYYLKRKNSINNVNSLNGTKKHHNASNTTDERTNEICHVQISPTYNSQPMRPRKRLLSDRTSITESVIRQ